MFYPRETQLHDIMQLMFLLQAVLISQKTTVDLVYKEHTCFWYSHVIAPVPVKWHWLIYLKSTGTKRQLCIIWLLYAMSQSDTCLKGNMVWDFFYPDWNMKPSKPLNHRRSIAANNWICAPLWQHLSGLAIQRSFINTHNMYSRGQTLASYFQLFHEK